jgi:hypothetical protein
MRGWVMFSRTMTWWFCLLIRMWRRGPENQSTIQVAQQNQEQLKADTNGCVRALTPLITLWRGSSGYVIVGNERGNIDCHLLSFLHRNYGGNHVAFIQNGTWEFSSTLHTGVQSVFFYFYFLCLLSTLRQVTDLPMRRLVIGYRVSFNFRVGPICKYRIII